MSSAQPIVECVFLRKCLLFTVFAMRRDVQICLAHTKFKYHIALAVQPVMEFMFKCIQIYLLNNSINNLTSFRQIKV